MLNLLRSCPVIINVHRPLVRLGLVLALATAAQAQIPTPVQYGDPARQGQIVRSNQTDFYALNAQQGDTLRVTFSSQSSSCGYNCTYYHHQLDVWDGPNLLRNITGYGVLTVSLPRTGTYMVTVQARNLQSTGWYAFQLNRLNDPVGADRVAFNMNTRGSISAAAGFAVYTLRADAGSSAILRFNCESSSCGYNCTYYHLYAELLDSTGTPVATVVGPGQSSQFTFQTAGVYTLFIAARNYQSTGWFNPFVACQSWQTLIPCDTVAASSNYGTGWPGTNGVPALTGSARPLVNTVAGIDVGNSSGQDTIAVVFVGIDTDNQVTPFDGTLLVASSAALWFLPPVLLPAGGTRIQYAVPPPQTGLLGLGVALQSVINDPGASQGLAFSRGLLLVFGDR